MTNFSEGSSLGPFRIDGVLGQGAMSIVYRARDRERGTSVALKVLRGELLAAAERKAVLARFRREARIGMQLDHPNIVRVHDFGEAGGSPWLAMELVTGRELKEFMEAEPPMPIGQAVGIMRAVLHALGYAHANKVVHRDIKPANIVMREDGVPKLADFGIAQVPSSDVTQAGELLGTPAYVAPEQLRGEETDGRSDLFSAGVILYYLLSRRRPFAGSVAVVMQRILFSDPPPPSSVDPRVPRSFDAVIMKALAKDPAQRWRTAEDLADALDEALAAGALALVPVSAMASDETMAAAPGGDGDALDRLEELLRGLASEPLSERKLADARRWLEQAAEQTAGRERLFRLAEDGAAAAGAAILAAIPAPRRDLAGSRADWMAQVRLFACLRQAIGGSAAVDSLKGRIAAELLSAVMLYSSTLGRDLMVDDNPDLMRLSADFMRLDVLMLALDELGAEMERRNAETTMLMFAGQVMRKVNMILRGCTEGNDGLARFGVAVILADIEELIVMAGRVLETSGDTTHAFRAIGQEIIGEFTGLCRSFVALSLGELQDELTDGSAGAFAAKLRPLGALYAFATRLPRDAGGSGGGELAGLTDDLHRGVGALTEQLATATRPGDDDGRQRLEAICEMAESLGWTALESAAHGALRRLALG